MVGFLGLCRHFAKRKVEEEATIGEEEAEDDEEDVLKFDEPQEVVQVDVDVREEDEESLWEVDDQVLEDPLLIEEEVNEVKNETDVNEDFFEEIDRRLEEIREKCSESNVSTLIEVKNVLDVEAAALVTDDDDDALIDVVGEAPVPQIGQTSHSNIFLQNYFNPPTEKILFPFRDELDVDEDEEEDEDGVITYCDVATETNDDVGEAPVPQIGQTSHSNIFLQNYFNPPTEKILFPFRDELDVDEDEEEDEDGVITYCDVATETNDVVCLGEDSRFDDPRKRRIQRLLKKKKKRKKLLQRDR